jgi:hypothetical protein
MHRSHRYLSSLFFAAALLASVASIASARNPDDRGEYVEHVRYYDRDHRDFHHWDDREDRAYRRYLVEQHRPYVKFQWASPRAHRDYWNWRHTHPDND